MGIPRLLPALFLILTLVGTRAEVSVVITEFMANNTRTLRDSDGEFSDWMELQNVSSQEVNLGNWRLTDDPQHQTGWSLPSTNLPPGAFLLVFASGKERAVAGSELHASFRLAAGGEYLALLTPNGELASRFAPQFPAQLPDVAFGSGRIVGTSAILPLNALAKVRIPLDDSLEGRWTGAAATEPFDDLPAAGWSSGATGVGYDEATGPDLLGPMAYWDFNSAVNPSQAEDVSGQAHHGLIRGATYTADQGGFSGRTGDRALNFGNGTGRVAVPDAAKGVFDSASRSNALTVSLWIWGGANQPANTSVFWFQEKADGSGTRAAQAHLPWSDGVIYWDTGQGGDCCSAAGRISKAEPDTTRWKGRWNHYVFLKRGGVKEIWQNGSLFHRGDGSYPLATLRNLTLGAMPEGGFGYVGLLDDVALWDRALGADEIQSLATGSSPLALSGYAGLIGTDVGDALRGRNASAFIRIPFTVATPPEFNSLQLRIQYDAGFVAYLNGVEVARRNASDTAWNATAQHRRARRDARRFEEIDLPGAARWLRAGQNILALHGLNESPDDASFLIRPELRGLALTPDQFLPEATPSQPNSIGVVGFLTEPQFSQPAGFFTNPFELTIQGTFLGATLIYTTNGSPPSPTNGFVVPAPSANLTAGVTLPIHTTQFLRAAAFRPGFEPSTSVTRTYVFPSAVARQPARSTGLPTTWSDGYRADFEVDPEVVNQTQPGYGFTEALTALPTLSVVSDPRDLWDRSRGIYSNPGPRGDDWERPASAELLFADGRPGFQVNCGIHIHGNISRQNDFTPKHSFRLAFRGKYGPTDLEYPLFDGPGPAKFDEVVLKGLSTDSWPCVEWGPNGEGYIRWLRKDASYLRDQWVRDAYTDMGQIGCRGRFVHLFLNGLYWGIYNLTEHPSASFQAGHYGGARAEYDAYKDFTELDSGTSEAWDALMAQASAGLASETAAQRIEGNFPDGTRNLAYPRLLNVDNLIDYMVLHIAIGADDWPNHNWWSARRRGDESEGFRFFPWDQEISINSLQRTQTSWGGRYEEVSVFGTPTFLYNQLRANPNFRLRFADHVHRYFFNNGALTPAANDARWNARAAELDQAIVAESARWGDAQRSIPYRREVEWLANNRWMQNEFWLKNHALALGRFRRVGLYPSVVAPTFSQPGGPVTPGASLTVMAPAGLIYYTLDGSDPRRSDGTASPTALSGAISLGFSVTETLRVKARVLSGTTWSALTEAVFVVPTPASLALTELMYHPPPQTAAELARAGGKVFADDEFEFIELQNLSGERSFNLAGFFFSQGLRLTFDSQQLAPLERAVLVRIRAAFESRYGTGPRVIGEFGHPTDPALDSQLSNSGELLELLDPSGNCWLSFSYDDAWFPSTDGAGRALELLDPRSDLNLSTTWQAGELHGGTPGTSSLPLPRILSATVDVSGVQLHFELAPGQTVSVQRTENLEAPTWHPVHVEPMQVRRRTVSLTVPLGDEKSGFLRLNDGP